MAGLFLLLFVADLRPMNLLYRACVAGVSELSRPIDASDARVFTSKPTTSDLSERKIGTSGLRPYLDGEEYPIEEMDNELSPDQEKTDN